MPKGIKRYAEINMVEKKPTFRVTTPLKDVSWPDCCSLCCAPNATNDLPLQTQFESADYVVRKEVTTLTFNGIKICNDCKKRISFSKQEWILGAIGLGIGLAIGIPLILINVIFLVFALPAIAITAGCIFLIGRLFLKNKKEVLPMDIRVTAENKWVGKKRPTRIKFLFRNERYAYEFADANGLLDEEHCKRCHLPKVWNPAAKQVYCLNCHGRDK